MQCCLMYNFEFLSEVKEFHVAGASEIVSGEFCM